MARMDIEFPEDIFSGLEDMLDDVAPKMIAEALPIYKESMEKSIKGVLSNAPENTRRRTGDLEKSVTINEPKQTKNGAYIGNITFNGASKVSIYKRKKKTAVRVEPFRNYQKALALEYGNSHQAARPFLENAQNSCESEVVNKMQGVFNREVGSD